MIAQTLDIVTTAAILYAVATGLLLVFGVMKIINFAHGGLMTLGGYAALVTTQAGLNPWLAIPLAALFGGVVGMAIERFVVRPLYSRPLDAILATWGLSIIIGQLITLAFGRGVQFTQSPLSGTIDILGEAIPPIASPLSASPPCSPCPHRPVAGHEAGAGDAGGDHERGPGARARHQ